MPYKSNDDLPDSVKGVVPSGEARSVYREAFNSIHDKTGSETRAFAGAYAALVRAGYKRSKDGVYAKIEKCSMPMDHRKDHSGSAMIAFQLDPGLREALALKWSEEAPMPEPPEELHLTMFFLGKLEELSFHQLGNAEDVLTRFAVAHAPATASVGGLGRFEATESSDWKDVIHAKVASPELLQLRADLANELKAAGVPFSEKFDYTPHITLAYIDQMADSPEARVDEAAVELSEIVLQVGPSRKVFRLGGGEREASKAMRNAPDYRQSGDPERTCSSCIHGGDGYCDLHSFSYNKGYACDDYEMMEKRFEKFTPPQPVQEKAKRALEVYASKTDAERGLANGLHKISMALANGAPLGLDQVAAMLKFFGENEGKKTSEEYFNKGPVWQGWQGLGGNAGRSWARKVARLHAKWEGADKRAVRIGADVVKVDEEKRLVFGWASVIEKDGKLYLDHQEDGITEEELEKAAYAFVPHVRNGGVMHERVRAEPKVVSEMVESMVFTKEKQKQLGIDLGKVGWWTGWKVHDDETWDRVRKGELRAFSIHGKGIRTPIPAGNIT